MPVLKYNKLKKISFNNNFNNNFKNITFYINNDNSLTNESLIERINEFNPSIRNLILLNCPLISHDGICNIIESFPSLESIKISKKENNFFIERELIIAPFPLNQNFNFTNFFRFIFRIKNNKFENKFGNKCILDYTYAKKCPCECEEYKGKNVHSSLMIE